jgi:hypothetical protein
VESSFKETSKSHDPAVSAARQNYSTTPAFDTDWDISVDANEIDWDIGAVEQPAEETGDSFGSYEIIDANVELVGSENYDVSVSDNPSANKESEICWDITADSVDGNVHENANIENSPTELGHFQMLAEDRSRLLEKDYRNDIVDDLLEACFDHFYSIF